MDSAILQAFLVEGENEVGFVGNRTDCALLMLLRSWNDSYKDIRDKNENDVVKVRDGWMNEVGNLNSPPCALQSTNCPATKITSHRT